MVKNQNEQIRDYMREHDGYLTRTAKQVRFGKLRLSTSEELFRSMLSPEPCREALHAEVVECALFATLNSLKSLTAKRPIPI